MKIKYFLSILLAVCMVLEICLIPVSAWTITTESVESKSDIESQVDLSASLRSNNLVSGKDYVENEIIVCSKIDELESEITKYEDEYNLTLDFCFSNDTDSDDEKTATYLMSTTKTSADIIDIIEDMQKNESIVFAQPNYIYSYEDTEDSKVSIANENQLKNYANSQEDMFLTLFNKSSNWMANGGSNILIAVIDSGIDLKHPTLINSLWSNDGIYGYNFTEPSNIKPILLDNGDEYKKEHYEHGTAVAGIIGMQINSADGYACRGIAPGAKIIDLQISDNNTKPTTLAVIAALKKAEELGAKIANMSFATTNYDMALNLACNRAARNMVLLAAAGNEKTNERMFYPAAFSSVIGVMAYGGSDKDIVITDDASKSYISRNYPKGTQIIYDYSNYDARLVYYDVIAPGVNICSAKNGNTGNISGYWFYSGTSMASPIVTAAAAIYWQKNYNATAAQIRKALRGCGENIEGVKGFDDTKGFNKLDIIELKGTPLDEVVTRQYVNADAEGYSKLCELIKINLGYKAKEDITITNDDLTLISNLRIESYEAIGNSIDKLDELSRLISLTISGYDFNNTRINTLFNENQFEHLETLEICDTAVYKIAVNGQISSALSELNIHNNVNLSYLTNLDSVNISTFHLENNNISNLNFLRESKKNFMFLYLSGNKIKDLTPLTELNYVNSLYLSDNCVEDYTPILNVNGLSFVDLSENYLGDSENRIEDLLNGDTEHPIFVYKPFKDNFVEINNVKLNDFSVKRTDVDYIPKVIVSPSNATYLNNTSLTGPENDIVIVDRYTGQINYNPNYLFDATDNEFTTAINYSNSGVSGTSQISLLMPTISELNYEKYSYDTGINRNQITMLTTTDTTKIKVVQTYTENGEVKGNPVEKNVINDCEYIDYGDNRIITFNYDNAITADSTVTVYAGDSIGYFSSEVINSTNTIEISVENCNITGISGSSQFLNIIDDVNITGIESNAIGNSCNIENLYFPENIYSLSNNSFNNSSVKNAVFYRLDEFEVAADAFGICNGNFKVYTNYEDSELAEECVSAGVDCITDYEFGENTLLKYKGRATSIVLPECLKITTIGPSAFKNNRSLKTIDLGKAIYAINDSAFYGCGKLENVINAERVKRIGNGAFRSTSITNIDVSNAEVIGSYAFGNCTNILNIMIIGDTAKDTFILNDNAFYGCTNLKNISYKGTLELGSKTFGGCNALTEIFSEDVELKGTEAFSGCTALKKVVLSETSNIPEKSFDGCSSLEKVKIKNIKTLEIEGYAFRGTESLKELGLLSEKIYFDTNSFVGASNELTVYCNSDAIKSARPHVSICTDFQTIIWNNKIILDKYLGNSENVIIPECLEIYQIGNKTFYFNNSIKSVYLPHSIKRIGRQAFSMSKNLENIAGGKGVIYLGDRAFYNDKKLSNVNNLESVQYLDYASLAYTGIDKFKMPQTVYYCDQFVFLGCSYLKEIILSGNLYAVSSGMFYNCTNLERCIVKYGTKQYGQQIFDNCNNLKQIYIPDSAQLIQENSIPCSIIVYSSKNLKLNSNKIDLSNNIIYPNYKIINGVLKEYQSDTGYDYIDEAGKKVIDVPNAIETISERIFDNKRNVDKVILSDYLDVIEYGAFMDCTVSEIVMPRNMSSIGNSAFNRTKITQIDIPDGITKIDSYLLHNTPIQSVRIPNSVVEIGYRAFRACYMLKSIYIPDSVTAIDSCAFEGSTYPVTLYGNGNTYLRKYAEENSEQNGNNFLTCKLGYEITDGILKSYTGNEMNLQVPFGIGLTSLADGAFKNNTTIKSISIVSGITSIGSECFSGCTALTSIYVPNDVAFIGSNAFKDVENLTVYCNKGSYIEEYCATNNISVNTDYDISNGVLKAYNGTSTDVVIPSDLCITEIGSMAFYNNKRITSVILPEKTNVIGSFSFDGCSALTTVTLPLTNKVILCSFAFGFCNNLTTINNSDMISEVGSYAFTHCSSLENINLCDVKAMSYNVFNECTSLRTITLGDSLSSIGTDAFKNCPNLVIKCYADTYAYRYAVENEIQYILLNDNSASAISLRSTTGMDAITNNTVFKGDEAIIRYNPDQELHEYICLECNGEVNMKNIDKVIAYIIDND